MQAAGPAAGDIGGVEAAAAAVPAAERAWAKADATGRVLTGNTVPSGPACEGQSPASEAAFEAPAGTLAVGAEGPGGGSRPVHGVSDPMQTLGLAMGETIDLGHGRRPAFRGRRVLGLFFSIATAPGDGARGA